ncbi:MAG: hypothetical protein SOT13_01770 [Candidatus Aphodousia sp.]|nr:hypothetical protein [Sutterella sp.]MDY2899237.1 hypothetical protein [Candidatus Aphodousia sp.]
MEHRGLTVEFIDVVVATLLPSCAWADPNPVKAPVVSAVLRKFLRSMDNLFLGHAKYAVVY